MMKTFTNNSNTFTYVSNGLDKSAKDLSWVDAHAELITKLESGYGVLGDTTADIFEFRHYGFVVGNINLIINEGLSCEVLEDSSIHPIPLLPDWVIGASNVRGVAVPIINIEHFLINDYKHINSKNYQILIIGKEENAIGLLINNLPKPVFFEKDSQSNNFSEIPNELQPFVTFGYEKDQKLWVNIDFISFFESFKT